MAHATHRSSLLGLSSLTLRASFFDALDPRTRILVAVAFSVVVAAANQLLTIGLALLLAAAATLLGRLRPWSVARRMAPINLFAALLLLLLPLCSGQTALWAWGPLQYSREGLLLAVQIALKANAIVLGITVLLGTLDMVTLGHALGHLGVPDKLAHLLLFTVRYLDVLHGEYQRLRTAMKMRGFRPRVSVHAYRSYGYLIGMLLVRSLDRADRIVAAMKCRAFRGRFYLLDHFAYAPRDGWFAATAAIVLALLVWVEVS
jgi:cobalt/nickel transport system permease protein